MIILVTGATAGFGRVIAQRFAADGARIIAAGRRSDRLEVLRAELGAERVLPLTLDVRDRAAVASAIAGLPEDWAAIDVCVNNAGLALGLSGAQDADLDDWDAMVDTNTKVLGFRKIARPNIGFPGLAACPPSCPPACSHPPAWQPACISGAEQLFCSLRQYVSAPSCPQATG
jgi:NAD(P)-dependent dehydrogenase (short-subunit alcohol dehydrogenase family)